MLDDLRNSSSFLDEEDPNEQEEVIRQHPTRRREKETFLGMTAQQRFILSLMMFFMFCIMGVAALILSGSVALPGL